MSGEKLSLAQRALAARRREQSGVVSLASDKEVDVFVATVERLLDERNGELCELKGLGGRRFRMVGRHAFGELREVRFTIIGDGHCEVHPSGSVYTPADLARRILGAHYCGLRRRTLFVHADRGDDLWPGTRSRPVRTFAAILARARKDSFQRVVMLSDMPPSDPLPASDLQACGIHEFVGEPRKDLPRADDEADARAD